MHYYSVVFLIPSFIHLFPISRRLPLIYTYRIHVKTSDQKMAGEGESSGLPLFETRSARGGPFHKLFSFTMLLSILFIWTYRFLHAPPGSDRLAWFAMLVAEILFGVYWIISQSGRWRVVYRYPFKDRLSARYEHKLPRVDIFVCTADPQMEPPSMVIGTVLSVMSYDYPPEKLAVYLSDDGGSELTFYALLETSKFAKFWIPFCKKHNVEPRSPVHYFSQNTDFHDSREWARVKELYEEMKNQIDFVVSTGRVPEENKTEHKGFAEWNSKVTKQDHQSIVQILIDGWNHSTVDAEGNRLPTLAYVSREKKLGWHHNFKAGAMNALIRVSAEISNAPIILNVDCDMYANDPEAIRDALCFFLDEKHGHRTSYIQNPQYYYNIVKHDVYANVNLSINAIELCGLDGYGGAPYIGTGCFHRRESLCGKKYSGSHMIECHSVEDTVKIRTRTVEELENASKALATCSYENDTLWGSEMGLVYGCPVEDIVTGLAIQCRGWKPIYHHPSKHAFKGIAPTTLDVSLVQFKRWSEGMFQVFLSKYCPFIYGHGKIAFGTQMGYCIYLLLAPVSLPTFCYVLLPALYLIHGSNPILFPEASTSWFIPFTYFFIAKSAYTLVEDVILGDTVTGWWNLQRMILIRRMSAFLFAFVDTVVGQLGLSQTSFVLTTKVEDDETRQRYEKGIIDFRAPSVMLTIIASVALVNLIGLCRGVYMIVAEGKFRSEMGVCGVIVMLSMPVYEAMLWRRDAGRIPSAVAFKAVVVASAACLIPVC